MCMRVLLEATRGWVTLILEFIDRCGCMAYEVPSGSKGSLVTNIRWVPGRGGRVGD